MLDLWDRGFDANDFYAAVHATGAQILGRFRQRRRPPVLKPLADSSYLSVIGGVPVRIIEARVSVICTDGSTFEGSYRLATTLPDARRYPAERLVHVYHERWEHESAYYALRHIILHARILRRLGARRAPDSGKRVSATSSPPRDEGEDDVCSGHGSKAGLVNSQATDDAVLDSRPGPTLPRGLKTGTQLGTRLRAQGTFVDLRQSTRGATLTTSFSR